MTQGVATSDDSTSEGATGDNVQLVLPALPEYGRIARITAANLALRNGFDYPELEDIQLAIDEAFILLLGYQRRLGKITITFRVETGRLVITAEGEFDDDEPEPDTDAHARFDMLVSDLLDEHQVASRHIKMLKHHR